MVEPKPQNPPRMMVNPHSLTQIREFDCPKHPGEKIQRVAKEGPQILFCTLCLSETRFNNDHALPINEHISNTVASFEIIKSKLRIVDGDDEFSAHIDAEKRNVEKAFADIVDSFSELCNQMKTDVLANLDSQLNNFRAIQKSNSESCGNSNELTTEDGIISAINNCKSTTDFEKLMKTINFQSSLRTLFHSFQAQNAKFLNELNSLQNMISAHPKAENSCQQRLQDRLAGVKKVVDRLAIVESGIKNYSCLEKLELTSAKKTNDQSSVIKEPELLSPRLKSEELPEPPAPDSLFWEFWNDCQDIANQILESDYFQGIKTGTLNPNVYGSLMVQDAYYCYNGIADYREASTHPLDEKCKTFLLEKIDVYEKYNRNFRDNWRLQNADSVTPCAAIKEYVEQTRLVTKNLTSPYVFTVMIPCEYLWPWVAAQLDPVTPKDSLYRSWVDAYKKYPADAYRTANMLESYRNKIDKAEAKAIFRRAMESELKIFKSATEPKDSL